VKALLLCVELEFKTPIKEEAQPAMRTFADIVNYVVAEIKRTK